MTKIAIETATLRGDKLTGPCAALFAGLGFSRNVFFLYQFPMFHNTAMAISAAAENHKMRPCARGPTTINAAMSGPSELPVFPPT